MRIGQPVSPLGQVSLFVRKFSVFKYSRLLFTRCDKIRMVKEYFEIKLKHWSHYYLMSFIWAKSEFCTGMFWLYITGGLALPGIEL